MKSKTFFVHSHHFFDIHGGLACVIPSGLSVGGDELPRPIRPKNRQDLRVSLAGNP
jgi:hypothetical protein